jgi:hypothetical protein
MVAVPVVPGEFRAVAFELELAESVVAAKDGETLDMGKKARDCPSVE